MSLFKMGKIARFVLVSLEVEVDNGSTQEMSVEWGGIVAIRTFCAKMRCVCRKYNGIRMLCLAKWA